jgi:polar amino acid transport system substrate-binding protein/glutamate/aspartate transport system substrate-binding protein
MRLLFYGLMTLIVLQAPASAAGTLDKLRKTGVLTMGYREDAIPFSYKSDIGEAVGYTVDLCRTIASRLKADLGLGKLSIDYVPVTTEDRFKAVKDGRIDILCGATTATLSRRELVDFSLPTFISGASVLLRADGPEGMKALGGHKVGVRGSTTTEEALRNTLTKLSVDAEVVTVSDHQDGLQRLEKGEISAYFGDRAILIFLAAKSKARGNLRLSDQHFTVEPYALALPRGDHDFRLAVDRTLSRVYRSGAIETLFTSTFGKAAQPTGLLQALYVINALPE